MASSPFQVGRRHRFQWHPIGSDTVAIGCRWESSETSGLYVVVLLRLAGAVVLPL